MKISKLILSLLLNFILLSTYSQTIKEFPKDSTAFLEEIEKFMEINDRLNKSKEIIEKFTITFYSGKYSEDQLQKIYSTSDALLSKKGRSYPHFDLYLNILSLFASSENKFQGYDLWEDALSSMLSEKKTKLRSVEKFLIFTQNLISGNILYKSASTEWKSSNDDYFIEFKNGNIKIKFNNLDLTCSAKGDSLTIYNTSGIYDPVSNSWIGKKGIVTWQRSGFHPDSVNAKLANYRINMKKSLYEADSVIFINKHFYNSSLLGNLEDKVMVITKPSKATYPRFTSNNTRLEIKDIFKDIDYVGGFSMNGAKFIGSGSETEDAHLLIHRKIEVERNGVIKEDKILFLKASSKFYTFQEDQIVGRNTSISMYLDQDSIFHPGLLLRYYNKNREINLIRDDDPESMSRSPYFNTFHNIDMEFELLRWKIDEPDIDITMLKGSAINTARFESLNYFREERYTKLQGMDLRHPFIILRNYAKIRKSETYTGLELADYMRKSVHQVRQMLIRLSFMGIVDFDVSTDIVTNKQRLYDYLDAVVGKKDYDVLDFVSSTDANVNNAILNLKNFDLKINGVPEIYASDSQNVVIFPYDESITLKKDRNFDFEGVLNAGYFTFFGHNFTFDYDSFLVDLHKIDSLRISVPQGIDNWGQKVLSNVESTIEMVTGQLRIDDPNNKSGIKDFPNYPTFNSTEESFVYYDNPTVYNGVYARDSFYFKMDPYVIDSINSFKPEGMGYDGTLISNIFPEFRDRIIIQEDNSLGFTRPTPEEGFPIYVGKGQYYNDISLSNKGLEGNGKLEYLTSTTYSEEFKFFPDSTNALATRFKNEKKTSYPQYPSTDGKDVLVHWIPKEEDFYITTQNTPMSMYDEQASINGVVLLEPNGLTGKGKMNVENSQFSSESYTYTAEKFLSDSADLNIFTENKNSFAFKTENVRTTVDFREKKSIIESKSDVTKVELPENQYVAYVKGMIWDMENQDIELKSQDLVHIIDKGESKVITADNRGGKPSGSHFISTNPKQDSLDFVSPVTNFDLKNNIINAHQVYSIKVADATVFPGDGEIVVNPKAKMQTLKEARVIADNEFKHHNFFDAMVNILGAKDYNGSGNYNYVDENGRKQTIYYELIAVDTGMHTYAKGKIPETRKFQLSPYFDFFGEVELYATRRNLNFIGYTKILHDCNQLAKRWVKFESIIDPKEIYIPISDEPKDQNNNDLFAGIMMNTDSTHIFSTFLSPNKRYSDKYILTASEYIHFNKSSKKYVISSKDKIQDFEMPGNYLDIHRTFCNLYGEGEINLNAKLGQLKYETVGNVNHVLSKNKVNLDVLLALDFFFDIPSMQLIADTLVSAYQLTGVNIQRTVYTKGLKELVGTAKADELIREASLFGTYKKFPVELEHTILLTDLKLEWNSETNSYRSVGKIGIGSILQTQINKMVDGYLEIEKTRTGDAFGLYFEIDRKTWFFFYYKRGLLQAYSSSNRFNNTLHEIKASKRKMDVEKGQESYLYFLSNMRKKQEFIRRFEQDDSYDID
jgi:hypothetical protein